MHNDTPMNSNTNDGPPRNDEQKLEKVTEIITKALLEHPFENVAMYLKLNIRIAGIIDKRIAAKIEQENNQALMTRHGASIN